VTDPTPEPLAAVVEVLARRGVLTVVTVLTRGPASYRALERHAEVSGSVLQQRLRDLRQLGVVEVSESGDYRLSAEGRKLLGVLDRLDAWARDWATRTPRSLRPRGSYDTAYDEPDPD
jgi:DNA-binding HxlR family transcriptional regulator